MTKNLVLSAVLAASSSLTSAAFATSVSYYLDSSNRPALFPAGANYLQVTIDDHGIANDKIYFTVTPLAPLTSIAGSHFGIDKFAFNGPSLSASSIGLPGWTVSNPHNVASYGDFNNLLSDHGNRLNPLSFSISAANDSVGTYAAALSNGSAFFVAHVGGFKPVCKSGTSVRSVDPDDDDEDDSECKCITSAYFGGSTAAVPPAGTVPLPTAAWLFASGLLGIVGVSRRSTGHATDGQ